MPPEPPLEVHDVTISETAAFTLGGCNSELRGFRTAGPAAPTLPGRPNSWWIRAAPSAGST